MSDEPVDPANPYAQKESKERQVWKELKAWRARVAEARSLEERIRSYLDIARKSAANITDEHVERAVQNFKGTDPERAAYKAQLEEARAGFATSIADLEAELAQATSTREDIERRFGQFIAANPGQQE